MQRTPAHHATLKPPCCWRGPVVTEQGVKQGVRPEIGPAYPARRASGTGNWDLPNYTTCRGRTLSECPTYSAFWSVFGVRCLRLQPLASAVGFGGRACEWRLESPKPKAQSPKSAGGSSGRVLGSSELAKDDGAVATEYRLPITDYWLKTTCRGGAAVLLVGFWFDGGLFKLATAATFWMLLELGREEDHEIHSAAEPQPEELNKLHGLHELHRF